jgi:hypothetical protein
MIVIQCGDKKIELTYKEGDNTQETLMKNFGWLLKPIIKQTNCYQKAIEILNWKIQTK